MPNLADIIVKKSDGTTDVTYKAISPAAGEGSQSVWKNQTVGATVSQQPEFRFAARGRTQKGSPFRVCNGSYKWPRVVTNVTTGEISISDGVNFFGTVEVNQNMTPAEIREAVYQAANLWATAAIKAACVDGYGFF